MAIALWFTLSFVSSALFAKPARAAAKTMSGSYVRIKGNTIHYVKAGQGPPIVLVHGFGAWSFTWRKNIKPLSKHFTVYAIDLLGFGLSDKPKDGPYSVEAQASLVAAFMRKMGLKDVTLIGNSLGGEIALLTASRYPDTVSSLVLIDSTGYRRTPDIPAWAPRPLLRAGLKVLLVNRLRVINTLRLAYYNKRLISGDVVDGYYLPVRTHGVTEALTAMAAQLKIGYAKNEIAGIDKPVLIIWGEHDEIIPLVDAYKFHAALRYSQVMVIKDSGHVPQEETPDTLNRLITEFLAEPAQERRARER
jgi:pimeloyl-ACP methyl ester carboxylesterase